jgi:uncharacterized protein YndB with AHSA1/START domain
VGHYRFESEWELTAPIDAVFELLSRPEEMAVWWPSVIECSLLEEGDETGVGTRVAYTLRSPVVYSLSFEAKAIEVDRPRLIRTLVRGDLIGTGTYLLDGAEGGTTVRFLWHVATTKRWMNLLAPVARPLFVWAHTRVMEKGAAAMAQRLGARLLSADTLIVGDEKPPTSARISS